MNGWKILRAAAAGPSERLEAAIADPDGCQATLIRSILDRNSETAFGRAHGFSGIRSVADYRAAVPNRRYDDVAGDMEAIAAGEHNRLVSERVVAFERTGGTTSGGKLIPYTARSLVGFRAAVLPWLGDLAARHPAIELGSAYVSISPATRQPETTTGGIPVGLETDAAYLGEDLVGAFAQLLAVSPQTGAIADIDAWRLSTLTQLVESADLAFVSVWSPTFFTGLIEALPMLADPIRRHVGDDARRRLDDALRGDRIETEKLWPRLAVVSCWADGGSRNFARKLAQLCPQATLQPKGLLATEAAITLPFGDGPGAVPALTSTFIEFRDKDGGFHGAGDLNEGESYDVIVTTDGGLYRYDIGDRLKCVGHDGACARLEFDGRASLRSDMVGEKLDESFVAAVLADLPVGAMLAAHEEPRPHYELWLDGPGPPDFGAIVETGLLANPQYAYARKNGQLGPVVVLSRPGFPADIALSGARQGKRYGDVKPVALRPVGG